MKLFILEDCPYCLKARQYIKELKEENDNYQKINIELIDEAKESDLANQYDYYYVPTFYNGQTKLHEGAINKEEIKDMFDSYLGEL